MGATKELYIDQKVEGLEREYMARRNPQNPIQLHWMQDALRYHYELKRNVKTFLNNQNLISNGREQS